jgi:hypothetical protein
VTRAQLDQLVERIAAGIRVLRTLHGVTVSEDQVFERARNLAMSLSLNYALEPLDGDGADEQEAA